MGLSCELPGETSGQGGRGNYPPSLMACQWAVEGDPIQSLCGLPWEVLDFHPSLTSKRDGFWTVWRGLR
jgi:hypothetical protein